MVKGELVHMPGTKLAPRVVLTQTQAKLRRRLRPMTSMTTGRHTELGCVPASARNHEGRDSGSAAHRDPVQTLHFPSNLCFSNMKRKGTDHRTALACRGLIHRLSVRAEQWS